ncbi:1,4-alpha-glucan branching enzyme GlgB [bioreactor metagenome]|uniref:1,4-alpha-glucan branching enzyme n=1 Tax=bioreactor metagenome TaxID=1076179 RepID=A0A644VWF4_9ZZZZ
MEILPFVKNDPYLEPYAAAIYGRYDYFRQIEKRLLTESHSLSEFATGYLYFGLHRLTDGWVFREWAPNATAIFMIGDFNNWQKHPDYQLKKLQNGIWEIKLPEYAITHSQLYKLLIQWEGDEGERIPAWARRVVQDHETKIFSAQVWQPLRPYNFKIKNFKPQTKPLLIYECHIGMSGSDEKVSTYNEFRINVLPRVIKAGYNCIQLMAIQEHPYYGSFGYHVSSFFAASSRFGTPDELKILIDEAHENGIAVIMDIVHSHAVKNEVEGLGRFDGTPYQYFHGGHRREHPAWDSLCFDYGKPAVIHFLLSNCKYWLEEFKFDGFRFDGVTSMLYRSHGLGEDFGDYSSYYNLNQDGDAICYLTLANKLIHEVNPNAVTIAEEVSGMPGLAVKVEDGGIGFDYRMAMGIPDFWIKYIKEVRDEDWKVGHIFWELTNRRADEKTVNYAESHDQAMVGDKTIIFRLIDAEMYWHMQKGDNTLTVDRGVALHKMIRLITATTINGAYLNFMGNEFGHPEWIDFPREGNGWSHKYARRQWELVDNEQYLYHDLGVFDRDMITLIKSVHEFNLLPIQQLWDKEDDKVLAYQRGNLIFIYNFNGDQSYVDYGILADKGTYKIILNTDNSKYGGYNLVDESIEHITLSKPVHESGKEWLMLYLPARSALILKKTN